MHIARWRGVSLKGWGGPVFLNSEESGWVDSGNRNNPSPREQT